MYSPSWLIQFANVAIYCSRSVYYLLCIAGTLLFFSEVGGVGSSLLHVYIPISSNIAIFLGVGLVQIFSTISIGMRRSSIRRRFQNAYYSFTNNDLPQWEDRSSIRAALPASPPFAASVGHEYFQDEPLLATLPVAVRYNNSGINDESDVENPWTHS